MNTIKKNWKSLLIGVGSIAFGFLAVFLGGKLYLTRNQSISPSAPESKPGAAFTNACQGFSLTFNAPISTTTPEATATESPIALASETPTAVASPTDTPTTAPTTTATSSPTSSPTASPTDTPQVACNTHCSSDAFCKAIDSSYTCYPPTSTCRLSQFPERDTCDIPATTSPTPHNAFECNSRCSSNSECQTIGSNYTCYNTGTDSRCRVTTNLTSATCGGNSIAKASTVPSPVSNSLPQAGIGLPTTMILSFAAILILGSFLLI